MIANLSLSYPANMRRKHLKSRRPVDVKGTLKAKMGWGMLATSYTVYIVYDMH